MACWKEGRNGNLTLTAAVEDSYFEQAIEDVGEDIFAAQGRWSDSGQDSLERRQSIENLFDLVHGLVPHCHLLGTRFIAEVLELGH